MAVIASPDRCLRARILDEATRLFADQGFAATSVRQLVEACQCTKPSLYYYFDSKESLFREVVDQHFKSCEAMIQTLFAGGSSVRDAVHQAVEGYITWAEAEPSALRLLQRVEARAEEGAPELDIGAAREKHLQLIASLFERGKASGELRADVMPLDCAVLLAGALSFQFEIALGVGRWDREQIRRTIDMIFDGISA